jgi:mycothiol synthase
MRRLDLKDLPDLILPEGYMLRRAVPDDAPRLARLLQAAFPEMHWDEEQSRERLLEAPDVTDTLLICREDVCVASASARLLPVRFPGSGYVHWVGSDPEHRGRRLGATVTLAVLHRFVELQCESAVLETEDWRLPAIRTYLRLGFLPIRYGTDPENTWAKISANLGIPSLHLLEF